MLKRVHILISGDVQGIGFRFSTIQVARDLKLTGWVRNNPESTVEIIAEGEEESLENLIAWAKEGPKPAKVANVKIDWQKPTGDFDSFDVRY